MLPFYDPYFVQVTPRACICLTQTFRAHALARSSRVQSLGERLAERQSNMCREEKGQEGGGTAGEGHKHWQPHWAERMTSSPGPAAPPDQADVGSPNLTYATTPQVNTWAVDGHYAAAVLRNDQVAVMDLDSEVDALRIVLDAPGKPAEDWE